MSANLFRNEVSLLARRYLALWFPFLPTDRLRLVRMKTAAAAPDRPQVIVEKLRGALRLSACDHQALELGLTPGLALADARARVPHIAAAEAEPDADARLLTRLAAFCERYTPLVALDEPHGLVLDITGCTHLFGGEDAMRIAICARLKGLGFATRGCVAATPEAARALARFGPRDFCAPSPDSPDAEVALRALPLAALEMPQDILLALSRAGLKKLDDLATRSFTALAARFGEELTARLARILCREDMRIVPLRPPPDCMVERHFPEPLLDARALEAAVTRLILSAAHVLDQRGQGGRRFDISFFRSDGAVRFICLETGRPMRDADTLLRLYREKIDTLVDPLDPGFGFDALRLAVPVCENLNASQPNLYERNIEEEAVADLVDRLVTRFGRERVLCFTPQDSHHPQRESRLVAASASFAAEPWPKPEPDEPPRRPLMLFERPQPIETLAEVPDGPPVRFRWRRVLHEIARAEGPERIAPEWWRDGPDEPTRDYYRLEDSHGARFWVFRAGLFEWEMERPRWFLHGLFA